MDLIWKVPLWLISFYIARLLYRHLRFRLFAKRWLAKLSALPEDEKVQLILGKHAYDMKDVEEPERQNKLLRSAGGSLYFSTAHSAFIDCLNNDLTLMSESGQWDFDELQAEYEYIYENREKLYKEIRSKLEALRNEEQEKEDERFG